MRLCVVVAVVVVIGVVIIFILFFFFSSRRRHTRCSRDWSSDVCSSDLTTCENKGWRIIFTYQCLLACFQLQVRPLRFHPYQKKENATVLKFNLQDPSSCSCSRSEEHTSELQSRLHLVCRLLLEKKTYIACKE